MDITQLRYFQAVARTGNVTKAARDLYVTQPNLSKSIARLEAELGVPLFDHRKGRIELNDYGRIFLSSVDIAFAQLNSGMQAVRRMYDNNQNILSLACNMSSFLADVLPDFVAAHPEIGIRQLDLTAEQMAQQLIDRSISLGISNKPIQEDAIVFRQLGQKPFVLALHQDHPLARGSSVPIRRLESEVFISDNTRMDTDTLRQVCKRSGFAPQIGFEVQSNELLFQLLEANRGIAFLPLGLACKTMHTHPRNHLRLLRLEGDCPPTILGIAHHQDFIYSKAARLFEEYMEDCLAQENTLIEKMGYDYLDTP